MLNLLESVVRVFVCHSILLICSQASIGELFSPTAIQLTCHYPVSRSVSLLKLPAQSTRCLRHVYTPSAKFLMYDIGGKALLTNLLMH